jgi:predicted amidophosphoribosyltransferase
MVMTKEQLNGLAKRRHCPRCSLDKTLGTALCRRCRTKLPAHMRTGLEAIPAKDTWIVSRALRAAANYLDVHFQSVRNFGGGRKR